jgi:hypothetical protein
MVKRRLALDAPVGLYALYAYAATRVARAPRLRLATTEDVRLRAYRPQALHNGFHPDGGHLVLNIGREAMVRLRSSSRDTSGGESQTDGRYANIAFKCFAFALFTPYLFLLCLHSFKFPRFIPLSRLSDYLYIWSISLVYLYLYISCLVAWSSGCIYIAPKLFYFAYSAVPYFQL